jgi:hypothetical protein
MIDKDSIDRLIAELQQLAAAYGEHQAFAANHAKAKAEHAKAQAEHDTISKELQQFRHELENLKLQSIDKRQELKQLSADITRRSTELQRIDTAIGQAKQRAFGG